ncbi:uncharacterized protein E0L32_005075 [Thyridium curvatum]|uniref:Uncharacterized protein n=1 Tax=Thyridium curvatum TaxID=1093900 RepID=A0A507BDU0_9PEZI|nr:uncharacterized protein E0L32_005075 [Thyridium curvatum]TPX14680.1 hypothetical protein E0L32_005075 [Thyridium curvatum]
MHIKHALVSLVAATLTMADANAIQARASASSAQLPTSLQQPSPTPSQSATATAGCKCDSGWPQGQYCGWCGPVQNGVSGDVYECGPNGEETQSTPLHGLPVKLPPLLNIVQEVERIVQLAVPLGVPEVAVVKVDVLEDVVELGHERPEPFPLRDVQQLVRELDGRERLARLARVQEPPLQPPDRVPVVLVRRDLVRVAPAQGARAPEAPVVEELLASSVVGRGQLMVISSPGWMSR